MIGRKILQLDRVDSTNTYANHILSRERIDEGTVIWANEQTEGRGQNDNRWVSEPWKNLTFSTILYPVWLAPDRQFLLNKAVSLGVLDFVREFRGDAAIKWPNDIYVGTSKVAGILIEHRIVGNRLDASIVGIGININQSSFARDIPNPISMFQFLHHRMELKECLLNICKHMDHRWLSLASGAEKEIDKQYTASLLYQGIPATFRTGEETFRGTITGVDDLGKLLVMDQDDRIHSFLHREIEYLLDK